MAHLEASKTYQRAHSWIQQLRTEGGPAADAEHEPSIVTRLASETLQLFRLIAKHAGVDKRSIAAQRRIQQSYSSFALWVDGYGVADGYLDKPISSSRSLRHVITELLVSISNTLQNRLLHHLRETTLDLDALRSVTHEAMISLHEDDHPATGSDIDSDGESSTADSGRLDESSKDLLTDCQCLMDLDPLIRAAVPDPKQTQPTAGKVKEPNSQDWAPHFVFHERISHRFPKARVDLVTRLAEANLDRFLATKVEREKNRLEKEQEQARAAEVSTENRVVSAVAGSEGSSKFHDSALGTSLATPSSYAETVMSYCQDEASSIRIPSLPEGAKDGKEFECIACGKLVIITSNSAWKKHLFLDLHPWTCLDPTCKPDPAAPSKQFITREGWVQHLAWDHGIAPEWKSVDCPLCTEPIRQGKVPILKHIGGHLEEISLAVLTTAYPESQREAESEDEESDTEDWDLFARPSLLPSSREPSPSGSATGLKPESTRHS